MKTTLLLLLAYLLICTFAVVCQAGGSRHITTKQPDKTQSLPGYAARTEPIKAHEGRTRLQIYSRKTGRVAWSGIVGNVGEAKNFSWSADHTATAMTEDLPEAQHRLLIWQAGKGMQIISCLPAPVRIEQQSYVSDLLSCDCLSQPILSPDKRRVLLLHSQNQGAASVGVWRLWCLTLRTRHLRFIGIYGDDCTKWDDTRPPQKPRWLNSHKIAYTQLRINEAKGRKWEYVAVTHDL